MFYLMRKALIKALSLSELTERVARLEAKVKKFEGLAAENAALWEGLDADGLPLEPFAPTIDELEGTLGDAIIKKMKPYGEA